MQGVTIGSTPPLPKTRHGPTEGRRKLGVFLQRRVEAVRTAGHSYELVLDAPAFQLSRHLFRLCEGDVGVVVAVKQHGGRVLAVDVAYGAPGIELPGVGVRVSAGGSLWRQSLLAA